MRECLRGETAACRHTHRLAAIPQTYPGRRVNGQRSESPNLQRFYKASSIFQPLPSARSLHLPAPSTKQVPRPSQRPPPPPPTRP
ncbi:hypothetical protein Pmani_016078 [Petrolisthes manimaculis]|uniref:Uncharacterized protein n=1 Tax=Petrolisthes manimaculis TaxID=1843537 RepID=A0AAE1U965_9EUCA|nr:hypothetical protein Pmani_016078 [Petrolisthes manimaculis]